MMFREEWRQNLDFARRRHVLLFPAMLALVAMIITIGLGPLTGEAFQFDTSDPDRRTFSWDELKIGLHLPLFLFSLGMGSFAFLGRVMVSQRAGGHNYLLAAPALQPLELATNFFAYYVKEVLFYILMILLPTVLGMGMGTFIGPAVGIYTPLQYTSLPFIIIAMSITLAQGLALSFLGSALWSRGGIWAWLVPATAVGGAVSFALGWIPLNVGIMGLYLQTEHDLWFIPLALLLITLLALGGAHLVPEDFETKVSARRELYRPVYDRLGFLGAGRLRTLVAKELVDLFRSGTIVKMLVSYAVPLMVLLLLAWLADFAAFPIPFNLLSYAPFLGFFGFNFYSWLNVIDPPDNYNGLPVTVPHLLRAKITVYFLITTWISVLFLILMAWMLDQWGALWAAMLVMLANSIYIVSLTAFLMGLRPNKAIFDVSIMIWFWLGTVIPLLGLFLLSFTLGDLSIYEHLSEQALAGSALNATEGGYDPEQVQEGMQSILMLSGLLIIGGVALLALLERRWGTSAFNN
jgi:hypothetical protein